MTKEQYLAIVASWKAFINEGKHKKYKVPYEINENDKAYYWKSNLRDLHHYIYALIRNHDLTKAFSENKIEQLNYTLIKQWRLDNVNPESAFNVFLSSLREPFGEEFTLELFREILQKRKAELS